MARWRGDGSLRELAAVRAQLEAEREAKAAILDAEVKAAAMVPVVNPAVRPPRARHYSPAEWAEARRDTFATHGRVCWRCAGYAAQVDHVKPKSLFPELALVRSNLRPICWPCNRAKNNRLLPEVTT